MRVLTPLKTSLFLAVVSFCSLAAAADLSDSERRQGHLKTPWSTHSSRSQNANIGQKAVKNGGTVSPTIAEIPGETKNVTWTTHALPKGNWIFTRYGINGTYPDNYP